MFWDAENRLTNITSLSGAATGSLVKLDITYDYMNRRIQKIVSTNNGSSYVPSYTNKFIYDGWNVVAVLDGSNNLIRSFVWGSDLSGSIHGAGGVGGLVSTTIYTGLNAGVYLPAFDGNGNVTALADANNGTIAEQYWNGPFAELLGMSGRLGTDNCILFSTKWYDWESGWYYYGHRYYNHIEESCLSRDPLEEEGGLNLYRFGDNDLVNKWDDNGLKCGSCKCKGVKISYTPNLDKKKQLVFGFYGKSNNERYGLTIHIDWTVDGDPSLCTYAVLEPPGGVTGSTPSGSADPSDGTGGEWFTVPQNYDDTLGIPVKGKKGKFTIKVDLTQTYGCWNDGADTYYGPSVTVGPNHFVGSGSKKK